jgi:hypothetical protein
MRLPAFTVCLALATSISVSACTCIWADAPPDYVAESDIVFQGVVLERKVLPARPDMRGRERYAITLRVERYWKGDPGPTVVIHGLEPLADCLGGGELKVDRRYLLFVSIKTSQEVFLEDYFWYGWTDVIPEGDPILEIKPCTPSGEISRGQGFVRNLGKGRTPKRE